MRTSLFSNFVIRRSRKKKKSISKKKSSKVILNNRKIKVIEHLELDKNHKPIKVYFVKVKGKIKSDLGKIKCSWILSEPEFWKFMEFYLINLY